MTELLENSDNTNADTGVSESPANEATISLAAVQALADALQKIESYTPTVWVDNESPDIDAAHLNKAEQAIMRVTTAMNSAVDVIKDLQSQVNTTNNNLSQKFAAKDISNGSLDQITTTGFYFGSNITEVTPYIKSHKWCLINAYVSGNSASIFVTAGDAMALSIYRNGDGIYSYYPIATKSDLAGFRILAVGRSQRFFKSTHGAGSTESQTISIPDSGQSAAYALVSLNLNGTTADAVAIRTLNVGTTSFDIHCKLLQGVPENALVFVDYVVFGK